MVFAIILPARHTDTPPSDLFACLLTQALFNEAWKPAAGAVISGWGSSTFRRRVLQLAINFAAILLLPLVAAGSSSGTNDVPRKTKRSWQRCGVRWRGDCGTLSAFSSRTPLSTQGAPRRRPWANECNPVGIKTGRHVHPGCAAAATLGRRVQSRWEKEARWDQEANGRIAGIWRVSKKW